MKRTSLIIVSVLALTASTTAFSQTRSNRQQLSFDYDLDFSYSFDGRDLSVSDDVFMMSEIINFARLTPTLGLNIQQSRNTTHRLMAGIDVMKDLGENPTGSVTYSEDENQFSLKNIHLFNEMILYYNVEARTRKGIFSAYAGIYPRAAALGGDYGRAFFSDANLIYDTNLEGFTLSYRTPKFKTELGMDQLGYKGIDRMLRYLLYSSGEYSPFEWGSAGWAATFMHIGGAYLKPDMVDNAMASAYLRFNFGQMTGMQELSLKAEGLASAQIDRYNENKYHFPVGAQATVRAKHWGFGIENTAYYGDNMMPFKSASYIEKYGSSTYNNILYLGEPFYNTHRGYPAFYDRAEVFYEPQLTDYLKLKVSGVGHFINPNSSYGPFVGWQARIGLTFNLDALRHPERGTLPRQQQKQQQRQQQRRNNSFNDPLIRL